MIREISVKGDEARFTTSDRGLFALGTGTNAPEKPVAKTTGKKAKPPADGTPGPKSVSDLFKM